MTTGLKSTPSQSRDGRIRSVSCEQFRASTAASVAVLELEGGPTDLGRRSGQFTQHSDNLLLGDYKRAAFELDGVLVHLELYRFTNDGTMTMFVDLDRCVQQAVSPLSIAHRATQALGLGSLRKSWVHTRAEELFWQRVDPHVLAANLS